MSKCEQCIVRQFNSFKALTKDELVRISGCKTSKFVAKGDIIFNEGEHLNGVYCVRDGICKVSKLSENGKDHIIKLLKKGDIIGQRSLINNEATNLSAVALQDMELCFIPKSEIINDLANNADFSMEMLRILAENVRDTDNMVIDFAQKSVKQRLAKSLILFKGTFGEDAEGYIDIVLTREEIANIIGTATESAIRLISEFKKKNFIETSGKKIKLLDQRGLEKLLSGI